MSENAYRLLLKDFSIQFIGKIFNCTISKCRDVLGKGFKMIERQF